MSRGEEKMKIQLFGAVLCAAMMVATCGDFNRAATCGRGTVQKGAVCVALATKTADIATPASSPDSVTVEKQTEEIVVGTATAPAISKDGSEEEDGVICGEGTHLDEQSDSCVADETEPTKVVVEVEVPVEVPVEVLVEVPVANCGKGTHEADGGCVVDEQEPVDVPDLCDADMEDHDGDGSDFEDDPHVGEGCTAMLNKGDGNAASPTLGTLLCDKSEQDGSMFLICRPLCMQDVDWEIAEICDDSWDNNCDGQVNEGCPGVEPIVTCGEGTLEQDGQCIIARQTMCFPECQLPRMNPDELDEGAFAVELAYAHCQLPRETDNLNYTVDYDIAVPTKEAMIEVTFGVEYDSHIKAEEFENMAIPSLLVHEVSQFGAPQTTTSILIGGPWREDGRYQITVPLYTEGVFGDYSLGIKFPLHENLLDLGLTFIRITDVEFRAIGSAGQEFTRIRWCEEEIDTTGYIQ